MTLLDDHFISFSAIFSKERNGKSFKRSHEDQLCYFKSNLVCLGKDIATLVSKMACDYVIGHGKMVQTWKAASWKREYMRDI